VAAHDPDQDMGHVHAPCWESTDGILLTSSPNLTHLYPSSHPLEWSLRERLPQVSWAQKLDCSILCKSRSVAVTASSSSSKGHRAKEWLIPSSRAFEAQVAVSRVTGQTDLARLLPAQVFHHIFFQVSGRGGPLSTAWCPALLCCVASEVRHSRCILEASKSHPWPSR
jgi:hypothetical protein